MKTTHVGYERQYKKKKMKQLVSKTFKSAGNVNPTHVTHTIANSLHDKQVFLRNSKTDIFGIQAA